MTPGVRRLSKYMIVGEGPLRSRGPAPTIMYLYTTDSLVGEGWFTDRIWTPHILIKNEHSSSLNGLRRENKLVRIQRNGEVLYQYRVTAKVFCNMELSRFPHDRQHCSLILESWSLNTDDMLLSWLKTNPLEINEFIMPAYALIATSTSESVSCYDDKFPAPRLRGMFDITTCDNVLDGKHFSTLYVGLALRREVGHYLLDYYVPTVLLVGISWVAFWFHPEVVPGRVTIGTITWLTFITLTQNTGGQIPRVSYIKFLDAWFIGCSLFIIASLMETVFVNSISRRSDTVTVRNLSARSILPAAASVFASPTFRRKSESAISLKNSKKSKAKAEKEDTRESQTKENSPQSSVSSFDSMLASDSGRPRHLSVSSIGFRHISLPQESDLVYDNKIGTHSPLSHDIEAHKQKTRKFGMDFEDMTSEAVALWVDARARIVFPLLFILFNLVYWFFASRADCAWMYECAYEQDLE